MSSANPFGDSNPRNNPFAGGPTQNPYASPMTSGMTMPAGYDPSMPQLATRGQRFMGALVDGLIGGGIGFMLGAGMGLVLYGMGFKPESMEFLVVSQVLGMVIGIATFLALNGYLLATKGQTIGKLVIGTRIVLDDGSPPPLVPMILKRYLPIWIAAAIPIVGGIYCLVNALMIFRENHKCLHDDIAGTKVIKI